MSKELSKTLISASAMGADVLSDKIAIETFPYYSVQFVWTGSPVGTVSVQASTDGVNWAGVTGASVACGGVAGSFLVDYTGSGVRYLRAKYAFTSGTGTLNAIIFAKSGG